MKFNATVIFLSGSTYHLELVGTEDKEDATLKLIKHIIQQRIWTTQILKQIILEEQ